MIKKLLLLSGLTLLSPDIQAAARPANQVAFSPDGGAEALVLSVIDSARDEIRLAGYSFTSPDVARSLIRDRSAQEYELLKSEVVGTLPDFDVAYDTIGALYRALTWDLVTGWQRADG